MWVKHINTLGDSPYGFLRNNTQLKRCELCGNFIKDLEAHIPKCANQRVQKRVSKVKNISLALSVKAAEKLNSIQKETKETDKEIIERLLLGRPVPEK